MLLVEDIGQRRTGAHRFAKRPDVALPQFDRQRLEDARCGDRIAERAVALPGLHAKPGGERFEAVPGQVRVGDLRQQARVERCGRREGEARAPAFAGEDREIEADRMADPEALARVGAKRPPCLVERGRIRHRGIVDAVHVAGGLRDGLARIDPQDETLARDHAPLEGDAPNSTMRALLVSRPVVSVSTAKAVRAMSGVA